MLCGAYAEVLIAAIEQVAKDKRDERVKAETRTALRHPRPSDLRRGLARKRNVHCLHWRPRQPPFLRLLITEREAGAEGGRGKWKMEKADDAAGETQKTNEQNTCRNWQRRDNDIFTDQVTIHQRVANVLTIRGGL